MTLLEAVLEDNAVTYSTDRRAKQWTGGYYQRMPLMGGGHCRIGNAGLDLLTQELGLHRFRNDDASDP